jgi:hypothetical protein
LTKYWSRYSCMLWPGSAKYTFVCVNYDVHYIIVFWFFASSIFYCNYYFEIGLTYLSLDMSLTLFTTIEVIQIYRYISFKRLRFSASEFTLTFHYDTISSASELLKS